MSLLLTGKKDATQVRDAVVRFQGTNYKPWSFKMKCRLKKDGLWRITTGDQARPTQIPEDEKDADREARLRKEASESSGGDSLTANEKWDAKNDEAYSLIALSLADEYTHKISDTDNAKKA